MNGGGTQTCFAIGTRHLCRLTGLHWAECLATLQASSGRCSARSSADCSMPLKAMEEADVEGPGMESQQVCQ